MQPPSEEQRWETSPLYKFNELRTLPQCGCKELADARLAFFQQEDGEIEIARRVTEAGQ